MTLVNEMIKYLNGEISIVNTYYDNISPCIYCTYCWENDGCSINDEMQVAIMRANTIFRNINAKSIGTITSLQTNNIPAKEDLEALSEAEKLALQFNTLNQ